MTDAPLLSFIVLSYNYEHYIRITIESILAQSVQDFEVVVVDDASKDGSCGVIRSFADPRIRLFVNEQNIGGAASYNRAVQAATGRYLVNLDADDWISPAKCERQLQALASEPVDILGSYAHFVGADGEPHPKAAEFENFTNQPHDFNQTNAWIGRNNLVRSTTMMDRAAHLRCGLDDPTMVRAPDYELWTRALACGCRFGLLKEPLTYYRVHDRNVTHRDPPGTFLELSYATLKNLVPLIEAQGHEDELAQIANWMVKRARETALPEPEVEQLLGRLLGTPQCASFEEFLGDVRIGHEHSGVRQAGRRLLAMLGTESVWQRLEQVKAGTASIAEARDFWHKQSQAYAEARDYWYAQGRAYAEARDFWHAQVQPLEEARDFWQKTSASWQEKYESAQQQPPPPDNRGCLHERLRLALTYFRGSTKREAK